MRFAPFWVAIKPNGAINGLTHLPARGRGDKRRGKSKDLIVFEATGEVDTRHNISPLVRPTKL